MLRPKRHITRKKLKEDQFVIRTYQTVSWLKRNQRSLIIAAIVLAIGILAFTGWRSSREAAEQRASVLALAGGYQFQSGDLDGARSSLTEAVTRYPGTASAGRATFLLAEILFQEGALDSARTFYQRFADRYAKDDLMKGGARAGLAAVAEQEGDYKQAADLYEQAARIGRTSGQMAGYLLEAARCRRLAGEKEEAISLYQRIKDDFPGAAEADRASIEMAALAYQGG